MSNHSLLIFVGNPTQYHSPIFRRIAYSIGENVEVLYGDKIGSQPFYTEEFSTTISWDVDLLMGFQHRFFKNFAASTSKGFWSRNNPGLIPYVFRSNSEFVLIHGYDTLSSWFVFFAALLSRKKLIWRGEATVRPGKPNRLKKWVKGMVLPIYFSRFFRILWSCTANRSYLEEFVDLSKNQLMRFPCAVDNEFFRKNAVTEAQKSKFRTSLSISDDDFVIITCSRLTKRKRTEWLVRAISETKNSKIVLIAVGDGPERLHLENLSRTLGVRLICTGFVGQKAVAQYLSVSNAFALLSTYDASPKALNEAMSFPLPLIVSDGVGTASDLLKPGTNGYLFSLNKYSNLSKWINRLANDRELASSMGSTNSDIIKEFSIEEGVENLLQVIKDN